MKITDIISAIQRTTHLKTWQMRDCYPELFEIEEQLRLEEIGFNTRLTTRSLIAEMRGLACPLKSDSEALLRSADRFFLAKP